MSKALFFFAILCVTAVVSVYAQDSSPEPSAESCNDLTDCTSCTGNLECGWCVSLKKCLPGNETGPANGGCLLWDYKTCPFDECERHEDCLACTLAGGECGWCNSRSTQAVCVSGNSTGPYAANAQCPIWDYEVMTCSAAKQCAEYDTCEMCANDTTCGWCSDGSSPRCSAGNASQPYEGTCNRWSYGEAACKESCFSLTSCDACKKANGCGWCNATSVCMPGGEEGPTSGTCEVDKWYYTKCPATPLKGCGASKNCTDCVSNARCGWCVNNGVCYPTGEAPEDCTFFRTGNCKDPCTDKKTCYSCGSEPDCGWCNSTGCVSGTSSGPAAGTCNEWIKNPNSCNNTNCTDFMNCEACTQVSNTHCGWCEYTRPYKCLYIENPPPQPGDPTCQFNWYYGNCPAPRDCRDYTSCGQCTAAECWWCGTNGCRDKKLFQNCFQTSSMCNPTPPSPGGDGELSDGEIAGIVIGSIAGAVLLVSLGVLVWYRFYWLRKHYYEVLR